MKKLPEKKATLVSTAFGEYERICRRKADLENLFEENLEYDKKYRNGDKRVVAYPVLFSNGYCSLYSTHSTARREAKKDADTGISGIVCNKIFAWESSVIHA